MEDKIFLGLGSNKGDRLLFIKEAIYNIADDNYCEVKEISSIYESKPFGFTKQADFYNCVVEINSFYALFDLYYRIKEIELEVGRTNSNRWGPREIDIDLLLYNDLIFSEEFLTVPHVDICNRDFVILPLAEIAPDLKHPVLLKSYSDLAKRKIDKYIVDKVDSFKLNLFEENIG